MISVYKRDKQLPYEKFLQESSIHNLLKTFEAILATNFKRNTMKNFYKLGI